MDFRPGSASPFLVTPLSFSSLGPRYVDSLLHVGAMLCARVASPGKVGLLILCHSCSALDTDSWAVWMCVNMHLLSLPVFIY